MIRPPPISTLFPSPTLSRSVLDSPLRDPLFQLNELVARHAFFESEHDADRHDKRCHRSEKAEALDRTDGLARNQSDEHRHGEDRKSTRLNSSHLVISYAVFC